MIRFVAMIILLHQLRVIDCENPTAGIAPPHGTGPQRSMPYCEVFLFYGDGEYLFCQ
jgi:hypothetical protein